MSFNPTTEAKYAALFQEYAEALAARDAAEVVSRNAAIAEEQANTRLERSRAALLDTVGSNITHRVGVVAGVAIIVSHPDKSVRIVKDVIQPEPRP